MSEEQRQTLIDRIVASDLPFVREDLEGWSNEQVTSVSGRLDSSTLNAEEGEGESEAEGSVDEKSESSSESESGSSHEGENEGERSPEYDADPDELSERVEELESIRREERRRPFSTILKQSSPLTDEEVDALDQDQLERLAADYETGDPAVDPFRSGTGPRQEQIEAGEANTPASMAAAPGGGTRHNAMSMQGADEPDRKLSGREAYEERKRAGGDD
jgi:hypothetical protein